MVLIEIHALSLELPQKVVYVLPQQIPCMIFWQVKANINKNLELDTDEKES